MKILVFVPLAPSGLGVQSETWKSLMALRHEGPLDLYLIRGDADCDSPHDKVLWKYKQARNRLLANDYDALLTIEADMIVPPDALEKLVALEADVAYGLYCWRHGVPWWNAYLDVTPTGARSMCDFPHVATRAWGQQLEVAGLGTGCALINRRVLERVDFWRPYGACQDWALSLDCQSLGFSQWMDLSVVCGHVAEWPTKMVIWPIGEKPFHRFEILGEEKKVWKYVSLARQFVPGVPARDLTDDEWAALTNDQKRLAYGLYVYYNPEDDLMSSYNKGEEPIEIFNATTRVVEEDDNG